MNNKREHISYKLRFEILRRDNHTCQYCGNKAPNVRLEIDHIIPVCKGGKTHILNLITSCYDCNRGKGRSPLSDDSILEKQRKHVEELKKNKIAISLDKIKLISASSSFDDILESWISYYDRRVPSLGNSRKECFLVLLSTLASHGYKKEDLTSEKKQKIIRLSVNPNHPNRIKLRAWIKYSVMDLEDTISLYYGLSITEAVQNSS